MSRGATLGLQIGVWVTIVVAALSFGIQGFMRYSDVISRLAVLESDNAKHLKENLVDRVRKIEGTRFTDAEGDRIFAEQRRLGEELLRIELRLRGQESREIPPPVVEQRLQRIERDILKLENRAERNQSFSATNRRHILADLERLWDENAILLLRIIDMETSLDSLEQGIYINLEAMEPRRY